jgi:aspartyl-tRNA synthetase
MTTASAGPGGDDFAKDNYGDSLFPREIQIPLTHVRDIGEQHVDSSVKVRAWIQNARMQGKKMAFVELREEGSWSIQGLVVAGTDVSKEMVKWVGSLNPESFVSVEATVKRPLKPINSCHVANYELHLRKVFCEAPAPEVLGLSLAAANKAATRVDDEEVADGTETLTAKGLVAVPGASLATHMSNPVMHKRAPVAQAISDVRMAVRKLFTEYLDARHFHQFEPPCLIGAASEGGAEVFTLPYFGKKAYLAQSAQFYKQIEIAGGRKKVYSIGPSFRAENSNTRRHLTEVSCRH